jgi:hypothetical protein
VIAQPSTAETSFAPRDASTVPPSAARGSSARPSCHTASRHLLSRAPSFCRAGGRP